MLSGRFFQILWPSQNIRTLMQRRFHKGNYFVLGISKKAENISSKKIGSSSNILKRPQNFAKSSPYF